MNLLLQIQYTLEAAPLTISNAFSLLTSKSLSFELTAVEGDLFAQMKFAL